MNKKDEELIIKMTKKYNIKEKQIWSFAGWTNHDACLLAQKIDDLNDNKFSKIVLDEKAYHFVFGNYKYTFLSRLRNCNPFKFGMRDIIIDNDYIEDNRADFGINENDPYIVIAPQSGNVFGIIKI